MIKTKLKNLFGLAMFFLIFGAQFFLGFFDSVMIYAIIAELSLIFLLFFIKSTFYNESKILFAIVLVVIVFFKILDTMLRLLYGFKIPLTSSVDTSIFPLYYLFVGTGSIQLTISFCWLSYAELSMYLRIKTYELEPWVKKRYLILGLSSAFFILNGFILPFILIEGGYENLVFTILIALLIFIFSVGNLIGWVMPRRFKKYFNRNYKKPAEDYISEKDLIDNINQQLKGGS